MADKVAEQKPEETTVDVCEKTSEKVCEKPKAVEVVEDKEEAKAENGDAKAENGDSKDEEESKKEEESEKNGDEAEKEETDKCCIKRKSTAGETKDLPVDGTTPEKKAKLDEPAEAEVAA